jgi:HSP20 family protein
MTDQVVSHLQRLHFAGFHPPGAVWEPAVNLYAWPDRLELCVDLAGVSKEDIKVDVGPRQLIIRGQRVLPGSGCGAPMCERILMMEIADGRFVRVLDLPLNVDAQRVEARQENGWLWITLPKAAEEAGR